jgi:hypothetical protein
LCLYSSPNAKGLGRLSSSIVPCGSWLEPDMFGFMTLDAFVHAIFHAILRYSNTHVAKHALEVVNLFLFVAIANS